MQIISYLTLTILIKSSKTVKQEITSSDHVLPDHALPDRSRQTPVSFLACKPITGFDNVRKKTEKKQRYYRRGTIP
jgi:hypothetical protein